MRPILPFGKLAALMPGMVIRFLAVAAVGLLPAPGLTAQIARTPPLVALEISPARVVSGQSAQGTLRLRSNAPTGGIRVRLSSSNAALAVPAEVLVPAGQASVTFRLISQRVRASTAVTVTAVAASGGSSVSAAVQVDPQAASAPPPAPTAALSAIELPTSVRVGENANGTVRLSAAAPAGGVTVRLQAADTAALTVYPEVTVEAGASTKTFRITGRAAAAAVTITGTLSGASRAATMRVDVGAWSAKVVGAGALTYTADSAPAKFASRTLQAGTLSYTSEAPPPKFRTKTIQAGTLTMTSDRPPGE